MKPGHTNDSEVINMETHTKPKDELESLDVILNNMKKDPNHYNHGMTEAMWMQEQQRDD